MDHPFFASMHASAHHGALLPFPQVRAAMDHPFFASMQMRAPFQLAQRPVDAATIDFEGTDIRVPQVRKKIVSEIRRYSRGGGGSGGSSCGAAVADGAAQDGADAGSAGEGSGVDGVASSSEGAFEAEASASFRISASAPSVAAAEGGGVEMAGATTTPAGSETEAVGSPGGAVSVDAKREDGPKRLRR
jgi:hypothetical protein